MADNREDLQIVLYATFTILQTLQKDISLHNPWPMIPIIQQNYCPFNPKQEFPLAPSSIFSHTYVNNEC